MSERRRVNILQALRIAGVSRRTLYNWITRGLIESMNEQHSMMIYEDSLRVHLAYRALRKTQTYRAMRALRARDRSRREVRDE